MRRFSATPEPSFLDMDRLRALRDIRTERQSTTSVNAKRSNPSSRSGFVRSESVAEAFWNPVEHLGVRPVTQVSWTRCGWHFGSAHSPRWVLEAAVRDAKADFNQLVYWPGLLDWKNQISRPTPTLST
jgi:hypothetical protein